MHYSIKVRALLQLCVHFYLLCVHFYNCARTFTKCACTLGLMKLMARHTEDGAGVGDGEGVGGVDCWVFETEQGSQVQSLFL